VSDQGVQTTGNGPTTAQIASPLVRDAEAAALPRRRLPATAVQQNSSAVAHLRNQSQMLDECGAGARRAAEGQAFRH
jgi:hypothetical protein